jgi:hypothetical protein
MAQDFVVCDRERRFLLSADVREWLPEDHLGWFVDVVAVIDRTVFCGAYREDGHGRAAYEPVMVIALLACCWARGTRSARGRACVRGGCCMSRDRRSGAL